MEGSQLKGCRSEGKERETKIGKKTRQREKEGGSVSLTNNYWDI